ncbi:hypothetical protein ACFLS7_04430 [Bacteroidota bacterium]
MMQNIQIFEILPLWVIYLGTVFLILGAIRSGIAFARHRVKRLGKEEDAPINTVVGATLGLLAFILAFTFGMTTSRFDAKKHFLLDEVTAIETTWYRAGLIPEPNQTEVRDLLVSYVNLRIQLADKKIDIKEAIKQSDQIQHQLWDHTIALAEMDLKNGSVVTLFTNSVNQLINIQTKRISVALIDRIPALIWIALFTLIILAMFEVGFLFGKMQKINWPLLLALSMAFSAVILIIVDLDTAKGTINVNQQLMFDLYERILHNT